MIIIRRNDPVLDFILLKPNYVITISYSLQSYCGFGLGLVAGALHFRFRSSSVGWSLCCCHEEETILLGSVILGSLISTDSLGWYVDNLVLSTELTMWIGNHKEIEKLTFQALALHHHPNNRQPLRSTASSPPHCTDRFNMVNPSSRSFLVKVASIKANKREFKRRLAHKMYGNI